jgi:lipopolysaccharide/colanic/teichoic acid biosynthesis glycosyltransferase
MKIFSKRKIALFLDIIIISLAFLISIWPKSATVRVYLPNYWRPFTGFALIWLITSIISGKYSFDFKKKFIENWLQIFRSNIIAISIILILLYFFNYFHYSRMIVFGTMGLTFAGETILFAFWFFTHRLLRDKDVSTYITAAAREYDEHAEYEVRKAIELPETSANPIKETLNNIYLKDNISLFEFASHNAQLDRIPAENSSVLHTSHLYNIKHVLPSSQLLFVNLHEVNGWNRINEYLRQVNSNLQKGGFFVSCGEDFRKRHLKFYKNYPAFLATITTIIDFITRRFFQQVPVIREIFYAVFQETHKPFSQSEILGRVAYCGFEILDVMEKDNLFYFVAQKISEAANLEDPVYGALIKMKRVGKEGKPIYIYKFRTMFPYAEFLQDYVFKKNRLQKGGKLKNDFRIVPFGNLLRRLWIDELPQLYNLLKGDIKLVGVRAISQHYSDLYPAEIRNLRNQVKPGLIPPFYVDMPHTFKEIMDSECLYIKKYLKSPLKTDSQYFFKVLYNILFRHARSA